ncbi:RNA polymerase sigma factor [Kitasatospora sp. NPDC048239]|uniref:RNA polymerase sigma factor n=1 Tax=Kitasatospora sp. NPDC048239 TaxID=3364046 RepID=UPI0037141546
MNRDARVEDLLRSLAPQVLGAVVRRYGHFDACEEAVQDALLAAAVQWPDQGVPNNPRAWLITVAARRVIDGLRSEQARQRREATAAALTPADETVTPGPGEEPKAAEQDDMLTLLFLCCHPSLTPGSQVALTLRAVGGLTTAQIAHAFLVPESTMAQRISRAKQRIKATGLPFRMPPQSERTERLAVVLQVLYLVFNEGYTTTSGPDLQQPELAREAIRLNRELHRLLPEEGEVAGLLALMLLTDARRPARTRPDGSLIPLAEQDRSRWDQTALKEGLALIAETLPRMVTGPYQVQAAIAAVHGEAAHAEDTDWPQIMALYEVLEQMAPGPVVTLNHAVARAMVQGPAAGLELLATLEADGRLEGHHRLAAVRAHLLEMSGDRTAARNSFREAARRTGSIPERRYLESRADALDDR